MDLAIEHGQFDEAVAMSEKLSQREFASKLATAFDCQDYVKRKKVCLKSVTAVHAVCYDLDFLIAGRGETKSKETEIKVEVLIFPFYLCAQITVLCL